MFKLVTEIVAPWPVSFAVVQPDGSVADADLKLHFVRMTETEFNALFLAANEIPAEQQAEHNLASFTRITRGWDGVVDNDGKPMPFNDANIRLLLDFPNFIYAMNIAYIDFHRAKPGAVKKLRAAARLVLGAGGGGRGADYRESVRQALAETGMTPAAIAAELSKLPPDPEQQLLELDFEEDWPPVQLFMAMNTQWKTAGMSGLVQGLDYAAIEPTARLLGLELSPAIFLDLKTMEDEALAVFAEQRRRQ